MILAIRIVTGLNAILFLTFVIRWALARLRDRQLREEEAARPRCKHGRDRLRKPECEACRAETKAYFEGNNAAATSFAPFVITTGVSQPVGVLTTASTADFIPGKVTYTLSENGWRIPQRGEWWTPVPCKKNRDHGASIPVYIDWSPTIHEQLRAKCGCLVFGQVRLYPF